MSSASRALYITAVVVFAALFGAVQSTGEEGFEWGYGEENGPAEWPEHFATCGGNAQSPINILPGDAEFDEKVHQLKLSNYDSVDNLFTLTNTGHSVQISVTGSDNMEVSGGGLPATYRLLQFHFHWGSDNAHGSENTINNKAYPLEMHCVHYNTEFSGFSTAVKDSHGLAVLAVLFEIGAENNDFNYIVSNLGDISEAGNEKNITSFPLTSLLPSELADYYRFDGSLTTPTCDQSVIWNVYKATVTISQAQLGAFRTGLYAEGDSHAVPLVNNYRPVQPLNARVVKTSFAISGTPRLLVPGSVLLLLASFIGHLGCQV